MKSIILCEGITDQTLLQYYLRKACHWEDDKAEKGFLENWIKTHRILKKANDRLMIANCGGCSRILPVFEKILERNGLAIGNEAYENVVIVTDRDEMGTEASVVERVKKALKDHSIILQDELENEKWSNCQYKNGSGRAEKMRLLLLIIPFEETGAMETFLLQAVSKQDPYDAAIIQKGRQFVRTADPEERYLKHNKYKIKAEFDVYFSVRTASTQFGERQNILRNVPWEKYTLIQKSFRKLAELSSDEIMRQ